MMSVIVKVEPEEGVRRVVEGSRDRMVRSAAGLIARHGVSGTSFSDVLADSGAPRGSIYHHFPDGKEQLAEAAMQWAAEWLLSRQRGCAATKPAEVLDCFAASWRLVVQASGGRSGCTIAGVALDSGPEAETLLAAVRATFRSWVDLLASQLRAAGLPAKKARGLATTLLATMEGALILCRAEGGVEPLDTAVRQIRPLFA